jgi:hypothetical protein
MTGDYERFEGRIFGKFDYSCCEDFEGIIADLWEADD